MKNTLTLTLSLWVTAAGFCVCQVVDDFSAGGWKRFRSTPGTVRAEKGRLHLVDGAENPTWITASRTFKVDVDKAPVFVVKVKDASDRGTVKLIRRKPYDKKVAIQIDRPGLYAVDVHQQFGWRGVIPIEVCLYAIGDQEQITYEFVKFAPRLTPDEEKQVGARNRGGNVRLKVASFELVPLFNACSYYFRSPERPGLSVSFRGEGGTWRPAYPPVYVKEDGMYRGSIVNLEEDTAYELRIRERGNKELARGKFRTWRSEVPVARTIVLDESNFTGRLKVKESGSPDGWMRITAKDGFVLRNDRAGPIIELYRVKYILLDGLTLRGGLREAISIRRCEHVRVRNCDIAGWGREGTQRFDLDGKFYTKGGSAINWDSAILVSKSLGTVLERSYIHDPVSRANSWYYSHPAGPQAVGIDKPHSTVIRYNDFIGSDQHRWNDAIEGAGNFHLDGGFNRDADIYGNFMSFANDDALEIDGGQTNVRVFLNKFEGCLCGVSIQGCMSGPSYVFRNLLVNMGDERGLAGQTIKTSSYANGPSATSFLFNNSSNGRSADLALRSGLRIVAKNNIFAGRRAITGRTGSPQSECDYNLLAAGKPGEEKHGIVAVPGYVSPENGLFNLRKTSAAIGRGTALDNFTDSKGPIDLGAIPLESSLVLPFRPIPVFLDLYQLKFTAAELASSPLKTVTATVRGEAFSSPFRIAKNDAFDWFEVTPSEGLLRSGATMTFTVKLLPERMKKRAVYRGAFLIRLASGYSRPVLVYASTDYVAPARPSRPGVWVNYLEAESLGKRGPYQVVADPTASGGKCLIFAGTPRKNPLELEFTAPKTGLYFLLLRIRAEEPVGSHDSVYFSLDQGPLDRSQLRSATAWTWSLVAHNRKMSLICLEPFKLAKGRHTFRLAPREPIYLDLVALTDNPELFEH